MDYQDSVKNSALSSSKAELVIMKQLLTNPIMKKSMEVEKGKKAKCKCIWAASFSHKVGIVC